MNRTASADSGDLLPCSSFPGPHRTLVICNCCIAASPRLVSEYYWFACVLSPLLSRACGTSSSKTKSWRGWSNRTCWERQCHQYSIYLSIWFFFLFTSWFGNDEQPFLSFFSSRTRFPEIRYFQDDDVRTKLTDILFCYARENEQLLYKQVKHWPW